MRRCLIYAICLSLLIGSVLLLPLPLRSTSAQQSNATPPQSSPQISSSAAQQIELLLDEKESRTPAQKKIDSQLLFALKQRNGDATVNKLRTMDATVNVDVTGNVLVDIGANVTRELTLRIKQVGGRVVYSAERYNTVRASVPLSSLEALADSKDVKFIHQAFEAETRRALSPKENKPPRATASPAQNKSVTPAVKHRSPGALLNRAARLRAQLARALPAANGKAVLDKQDVAPNAGSVTSQGDAAHRAAGARNAFSVTGGGIRIGVLSDSDDFRERSQASGDLPPDVVVVPGQSGRPRSGEGTAMMEIVHDLAPGAKLFFATAFNGSASFADNIRTLRFEYGCDIIVDDVIYTAESPFQDDIVAQAVNAVTQDGCLYFSSAGNEGNFNDGTSGTWEGDFRDGGRLAALPAVRNYTVHDFGDGNISNRVERAPSRVILHWSDPGTISNPESANDYDLFVLNSTLTTVRRFSTNTQDGNDLPFESISDLPGNPASPAALTGERIVVARRGNAEVRALRLAAFRGELAVATTGATYGHNSAADAFGVAAVNAAVAGGGAFVGGPINPVELFSADGGRRIFYNEDGTPITPGNVLFSTDGGTLRQKPDIAAADGVTTSVPLFNPFFGTSAAAPHAAAIAALIKSGNRSLTSTEIRAALTSTALDIEASGIDRDSGFGIVMAFPALEATDARPTPFLDLGTFTATATEGDNDDFIEPGESGQISIPLINIGDAIAVDVNAMLTSSTPGVTITTNESAYPDLLPSGSAANVTPFTFTLSDTAPCGQIINFTLTTTYADGDPRVFNFVVQTGQPGTLAVSSYAESPVPIPDFDPAGVQIPLEVNGFSGPINDLNFRFDGTSCTNAVGAETVGLDHTYVGDLVITLTSPQGTTVTLINGAGGEGRNFCQTTLDDDASDSIQNISPSDNPFTGTFAPARPLAAFNGENPNGTWTLTVTDIGPQDVGSVRAFSLIITDSQCSNDTPPDNASRSVATSPLF